ncbi:MAG: flagellar protein G [Halobacteriaceae archaeon]
MASVPTSHLIIFIASLLVATSVAGTLTHTVDDISSAISAQSLDKSAEIHTDVEVISDAGSTVYDRNGNGNVTLLVKNTGTRRLRADSAAVDVLLDGQYRTVVSVSPVGSPTWDEGDVAYVNVSAPTLPAGDHRLKLVVNGDSEVFTFRT